MDLRMASWRITLLGLRAVFAAACPSAGTIRVSMSSICKASGGRIRAGRVTVPVPWRRAHGKPLP